ncbi:putative monooxygenase [Pholiota conissans]|uniref:Monooxygenase n=1 Tax=Pholiota conissans TaxID=109636 RepID=A0A9P5YUF2_9AGAR|nr:putative monooxygenase [Pholiota conissans]
MDINPPPVISQRRESAVLIIGAGVGGLCTAVQLQMQLGCHDFHIYDSNVVPGGVWAVQKYPGVACDVPADFYSFSFFPANWTQFRPSGAELQRYFEALTIHYRLYPHLTFESVAEDARWDIPSARWIVRIRTRVRSENIRDEKEGQWMWIEHRARILCSAAGGLVEPKMPDIKGLADFEGKIVQSAAWDSTLDLTGKDVAVFGNGPTGSQIVPAIMPSVSSLIHISRSAPWYRAAIDFPYGRIVRWILAHIPLARRLLRWFLALVTELAFLDTNMKEGQKGRTKKRLEAEAHIRKTAPQTYWKVLKPDFEFGCKHAVWDAGYLKSLNDSKATLIISSDVSVVPRGVSHNGEIHPVDVIILATGYIPTHGVGNLRVIGRGGKTLAQHWQENGGVSAYGTIAVNEFPNFFLIKGPNTASTNTSAILITENVVNLAIKVMKPVLQNMAVEVEVKDTAEKKYTDLVQATSLKKVWYAGCSSWYFSENGNGWNVVLYPFSQIYCWWSSLIPQWNDWEYRN